ncbi:hypothetical protein PUNSTDRAFT_78355, partial [Punctularia strigosozonata HHB-11173 SS5]
FFVFDADGYYYINIQFCACGFRAHREQLLESGWYPASVERPRTAFTFCFLDTFHQLTLQGKITLHDFYSSVVQWTNNTGIFPPIVRDRNSD